MNILHVGDLHTTRDVTPAEEAVFATLHRRATEADLVVIGGDFTNGGRTAEYRQFVERVKGLEDKLVLLRGNHDMDAMMTHTGALLAPHAPVQFEPSEHRLFAWQASWWDDLEDTHRALSRQQCLPEPYCRLAQLPVVKLIDGTGPYYALDRGGYRLIVLDTCQWVLGQRQVDWFEAQLATELPVLVFLHHSVLPTGSKYDGAVLFRRRRFLDLVLASPNVLGVFSGHVHYNKCWDVRGKRFVTTADRGSMRRISLEDGRIAGIEALPNDLHPGTGALRDIPAADDHQRFQVRHFWADDVVSPVTANLSTQPEGTWGANAFCWADANGPGGLSWYVPNLGDEADERFFGLNFRSTTPWRVRIERDGQPFRELTGEPGESIVISDPLPFRDFRSYAFLLEQEAGAVGHASPWLLLGPGPLREFNAYP